MDIRLRRKYAQAMRRIDYGVWGYRASVFRKVTLTTREGDDNSHSRFLKDFRKLISWLRTKTSGIDYCGCFELTPGKGLLHWHGILRVKGGYLPITRRELGDKWNEIHGAFAVELENVKAYKYLQRYINKHMVKNYMDTLDIRNRFLFSRTWVRPGIKDIIHDFKWWWLNGTSDIWLSPRAYQLLNDLIMRWCCRENHILKTWFGYFWITPKGVKDYDLFYEEVKQ